jgi:hypothetical protein
MTVQLKGGDQAIRGGDQPSFLFFIYFKFMEKS